MFAYNWMFTNGNGQSIHNNNMNFNGNNSSIFGSNNAIYGNNNRVVGDNNTITGNNCSIEGRNLRVIGNNNRVHGDNCSIIGNNNTINGNNNNAKGSNLQIHGNHNSAVGRNINATGSNNIINEPNSSTSGICLQTSHINDSGAAAVIENVVIINGRRYENALPGSTVIVNDVNLDNNEEDSYSDSDAARSLYEDSQRNLDPNTLPSYVADRVREIECKICTETFAIGDEVRVLPCCHQYHKDCIDPWLTRSTTCPSCTTEIQ